MQITKRRIRAIAGTFVPCFLFWLLLTMSLAPSELLGGVVVCLVTAWFSSGFFIQNERQAFLLLKPSRFIRLFAYVFGVLMMEIWNSNVAMAKTVLTGRKINQAIIKVPVEGITDFYALAVLADSITLTPGTITMDVAQDDGKIYMYVLWLIMETDDPVQAGEIIKGRMERWIRRIWE